VAGDGIVYLSQAVRLLGRPPVPVLLPLVTPVASALRRAGLVDFATDQLRFLLYGRVVDNERLKKAFGFSPGFSTRAALEDFIRGRRIRQVLPRETVEQWERDLYSFLRRRGAERLEEAQT